MNRLALEAKETTKSQHLEALRQRFEEKKERDLAEILLQSSSEDDDTTDLLVRGLICLQNMLQTQPGKLATGVAYDE